MIRLCIFLLFSQTGAFFSDFNKEMNAVRIHLEGMFNPRDPNDCSFFSFSGALKPLEDKCRDIKDESKSKVETRETKEYLSQQIDYGVDDTNKALLSMLRGEEIQQKFSYMQNVLHIDSERLGEIKNFILRGKDTQLESEAGVKLLEDLVNESPKDDTSSQQETGRQSENVKASPTNEEAIRHTLEEIVEILQNKTDNNAVNNIDLEKQNITSVINIDEQVVSEWKEKEAIRNQEIQEEVQNDFPKSFKDIADKIFKDGDHTNDKRENRKAKAKNYEYDQDNLKTVSPDFDFVSNDKAAESEAALQRAQNFFEQSQYAQMFMSSVHNNPDTEAQDVFDDAGSFNFG